MIEFRCQSCNKPKEALHNVESKLISGMAIVMCKTCIELKYEPRAFVILSITQFGLTDVSRRVLKEQRYYGEVIPASDIIANL